MEELLTLLSRTAIYSLFVVLFIYLAFIFTAILHITKITGNSLLKNLGINTLGIVMVYVLQRFITVNVLQNYLPVDVLQNYLHVGLFIIIFFPVALKCVYQAEWGKSILASILYGTISFFSIYAFRILLVAFLVDRRGLGEDILEFIIMA